MIARAVLTVRLMIEFVPPIGEDLESALLPVKLARDRELDGLGFEDDGSLPSISGGLRCQRLYYKLRNGSLPQKFAAIEIAIGRIRDAECRFNTTTLTKTEMERDWRSISGG